MAPETRTEALALPFEEAVGFFRRKVNLPTAHWDDLWRQAHGRAFMVAGAARDGLIEDFRGAVDAAIADGETLEDFRKRFDAIVAKHGWDYKGGRNWRSQVIYSTNVRTAYQGGRFQQMTEPSFLKLHPFWEYRHQDSAHPRPLHASWHGKVLAADDAWWKSHYPPNGWGCKCRVFPLTKRGMLATGRTGPDATPDNGTYQWKDRYGQTHELPNGIDPGWDYAPSKEWFSSQIPRSEGSWRVPVEGTPSTLPMPSIRTTSAERLLPPGLKEEAYVERFLKEFDPKGRASFFEDVTGGLLAIGEQLFQDGTGRWKVLKRGRETQLLLLADTLKAPDEVWLQFYREVGGTRYSLYKAFLGRFQVEGEEKPLYVLLRLGREDWEGVTAFGADKGSYVEKQRFGKLLYRREAGRDD